MGAKQLFSRSSNPFIQVHNNRLPKPRVSEKKTSIKVCEEDSNPMRAKYQLATVDSRETLPISNIQLPSSDHNMDVHDPEYDYQNFF